MTIFLTYKICFQTTKECNLDYDSIIEEIHKIRINFGLIVINMTLIKSNTIFEISQLKKMINDNTIKDGDKIILNIHSTSAPPFLVEELFELFLSEAPDIFLISKEKPVATIAHKDSKYDTRFFSRSYKYYTHEQKSQFLELIKNNITFILKYDILIQIYIFDVNSPDCQYIFYSPDYLNLLCEIFEYSLDQGLKILSVYNKDYTPIELSFIKIAFNDIEKNALILDYYHIDIDVDEITLLKLEEYYNKLEEYHNKLLEIHYHH